MPVRVENLFRSIRACFCRICLLLLLMVPFIVQGISQAADVDFQTKTLSNGLRIVYKVQPREDNVCVRFVIPAGLLHEPGRARGISHLLEHVIFRGSAKTPSSKLTQLVDDQGGYHNGFVFPDRTEFYMETSPANFPAAISIYNEFLFQPEFSETAIRLEKKIITVEKALRSVPANLFYLYMNEMTELQFDDSLNGISKQDLVDYHRQFYRTDGMTVIITGAFKPDEVFKLLGSLPRSADPALPPGEWLFHDPIGNIVLEDYLVGEKYRVLFGFDLENLTSRELTVAKVLPYILQYESRQYDYINNRPLDYGISLFSLSGHFFLVFVYRDTQNLYSLAIDEWHQKNLARYFKYLQANDFGPFLAKFSKHRAKLMETLEYNPGSLNEYITQTQFDPAGITASDLAAIRRLSSSHFKDFVQKHLVSKYFQKIVVKGR